MKLFYDSNITLTIWSFCPCDLITGLTAESMNWFSMQILQFIHPFRSCDQVAGWRSTLLLRYMHRMT